MSGLENLLERVRLQHQHAKTRGAQVTLNSCDDWDQGTHPAFDQIPWADMLVLCIDHKLKDSKIPGSPVCEGEIVLRKLILTVDRLGYLLLCLDV